MADNVTALCDFVTERISFNRNNKGGCRIYGIMCLINVKY